MSTPSVEATPRVISEEAWTFGGRPGLVIRTPHYRVFTTESDELLRTRMVSFLEYAMAHYRSAIAPLPAPRTKLDVYLMDNRPQWEEVTQRLMGDRASRLRRIERGGYASRGIGVYYDLGLHDTLSIASHEGWHQYTQRVFRTRLPTWLEEGLATYMEGYRFDGSVPRFVSWSNVERFDRLRQSVVAGRMIPLSRLVGMSPGDEIEHAGAGLLDFYAHVWALVHFLEEGEGARYRSGLAQILEDASSGELERALIKGVGRGRGVGRVDRPDLASVLFEVYFGSSMGEMEEEFARFCEAIVRTGSRERIVSGLAPLGVASP